MALEDVDVDRRIILKLFSKQQDRRGKKFSDLG
jgi:hypothetical protein